MRFTKLAIIGNGFDLAHGYRTTFKDFIESKSEDKSIKSFKEFIDDNYDNDELNWYEFESIADDVTLKWFLDVNFPDIQHDSNILLEKEDINRFNILFSKVSKNLMMYIQEATTIKRGKINSVGSEIENLHTVLINFNYSDTAELYNSNINYIHGSCQDDFIVLGFPTRRQPEPDFIDMITQYFSKKVLRESLKFKRFLGEIRYINTEQEIKELFREMRYQHIPHLLTGKGGYDFDYSSEINVEWYDYKLTPLQQKEILRAMDREREKKLGHIINSYYKQYGWDSFSIEKNYMPNQIEELIILDIVLKLIWILLTNYSTNLTI